MDTQLVVLGGGPGGYAAAFLAADLGMQVTLVDREPQLGGVCLLRGCIPSKALLHVAKAMAEARHLAEWGVSFARPQIDIAAVRARKEKVIATLTGGLKQVAKKRNVQVIQAQAAFEDSQTLRLDAVGGEPPADARLRFDTASWPPVPAPRGSRAFDLPTPRVMDSTGALELPDVPESLLVVGGGYIGLEMGTVYAALGTRVSVVEMTDGLLPGADRDLVKPLHDRLDKDVRRHLCSRPRSSGLADKASHRSQLRGRRCRKQRSSTAACWSRVGRRPNSAGLGLEKTKVQIDRAGFRASSTASSARPIRTSWPSATWPASRCWPTRRPTRAKWPSRCWPGSRPPSSRGPFRPWSSPIRKSPGPA